MTFITNTPVLIFKLPSVFNLVLKELGSDGCLSPTPAVLASIEKATSFIEDSGKWLLEWILTLVEMGTYGFSTVPLSWGYFHSSCPSVFTFLCDTKHFMLRKLKSHALCIVDLPALVAKCISIDFQLLLA